MKTLQKLWQYRSYIRGSVGRDFNLRYKGSILGTALVFLVPAFQISVYVLVFGNLLKGRLPGNPTIYGYSIYLCCGILCWNFFTELLQRSQNLYLENANLIKKTAFPCSTLSVINFLSSSINFWLAVVFLMFFLIVTKSWPGWQIVGLIPVWLILAALALGAGLSIAILQVFFRDFGALTTIGLQVLFWGTPIIYPPEILPPWLIPWLHINPLFGPVSAAQAMMLNTQQPSAEAWISTLTAGVLAALIAERLYSKHKSDLLDNL